MMKLCLLSVSLLATGIATAQTKPVEPPTIRIVCIGDSITKGARPAMGSAKTVTVDETFCSRIQAMLREKGLSVEVINAGVGSDRTDGGLLRLDRDALTHKPKFVTIMFGANDQCWDAGKTGPRITLEAYERNLREMVDRIRAAGAEPIIMTEPPLGSAWKGPNPIYAEKGNNFELAAFMDAARRVAADEKTPLVDHFAQWRKASDVGVDSWLTDGCHPNAAGHEILAEKMMETLLPLVTQSLSERGR